MCVHFWITDSKGFARCKHCGKTKQYKGYKSPRLKPGATGSITRKDFAIHPDFCAKMHLT